MTRLEGNRYDIDPSTNGPVPTIPMLRFVVSNIQTPAGASPRRPIRRVTHTWAIDRSPCPFTSSPPYHAEIEVDPTSPPQSQCPIGLRRRSKLLESHESELSLDDRNKQDLGPLPCPIRVKLPALVGGSSDTELKLVFARARMPRPPERTKCPFERSGWCAGGGETADAWKRLIWKA